MHFEVPKLPMHSFKDFAKHYLMIVLSILTALGLEQWIERSHHLHAAEAANASIRAELEANLADVRTSIKVNRDFIVPLQQLDDTITQDLRQGASAAAINQHIQAQKKAFKLSLNWPTFASQAWDVAVADQSASWLDAARLQRYAAAYANMRDASNWMTHDSVTLLNVPSMSSLHTRIDLDAPVDPMEFISAVRGMLVTSRETQSHLQQLEAHLLDSLAEDKNGKAHG